MVGNENPSILGWAKEQEAGFFTNLNIIMPQIDSGGSRLDVSVGLLTSLFCFKFRRFFANFHEHFLLSTALEPTCQLIHKM